MVSEVFEYPFDLAKVRLQSQVLNSTIRYGGPLDCLTQTWKTEGVRGLYRVRYHFSELVHSCLNSNYSGPSSTHVRVNGRDSRSFCGI
jgi:hypothetical protein